MVIAYGAIMGASIQGGLFRTVLGFFLRALKKIFPICCNRYSCFSIGLSLIGVRCEFFWWQQYCQADFGSGGLFLAILSYR